ncbi:hypothetical protein M9H77_22441 [Catharanthus roseus]|uniref:Uncharacterized protein n=1 Tax=Catharanthus roseus TaxID=4058 RepID=A0ACC0AQ73_CATRO|nr:hypothetical protein M9H77_22441 [Catharanthus roseus]
MGYRRASTPLLELMARTLVLWVFLHGVQHFVGVIELVEFDIGDCRVFYCHLRSTGSMLATGRMASGNGLGLREAGFDYRLNRKPTFGKYMMCNVSTTYARCGTKSGWNQNAQAALGSMA